ncbi:DUF1428 domain-containing protein [Sphingomonas sp. SUN039]|uniref:DUF1428 domain-containing protein n=1 Tax=Sphingomonas sp. SUN039 TaxID=2937787 RepID=UPI002164D45F|nr:DUF1428 domain-containing protein [Sphingomonas sp. SUN039]UVO54824.1 DUF1428 domain-containing protein [Sphingomonas sp. SUN039]
MYIDGFMASVKDGERDAFTAYANRVDTLFLDYGATRVVDSWGDDVPRGKQTDFYRAVAAEEGETVVFGWIEWPDKATRDTGWEAAMKDERMGGGQPPFDGKRMIFGAFEAVSVHAK